MKNKLIRFTSTIAAIVFGILLISAFTLFGNKSKGPLEDLFVKSGSFITSIEGYFINKSNKKKRSKKMNWFNAYRLDKSKLLDPEKILLGAYDNHNKETFQPVIHLENALNTEFPIVHIYSAWGDKPEQRFPLTEVMAIHELGSVPMVTWEPWLIDFDKNEHPHIKEKEERDKNGLADIAKGVYDFYLEKWVADYKLFDQVLFLRLGHEMNDPYRYTWGPQNNKPEDFIAAWQYVVDYFKMAGVDKIIWVWSPHIAYGLYEEYYPGDEYVDWVGVGTLNYGTVASWSQWWSFNDIFGNYYDELNSFGKPIMATEFGSLAVGGDRVEWYKKAFCEMPEKYPNLKSVVFFHFNKDNTLTYKTLDWYFLKDEEITNSIAGCINEWNVTF